MPEQESGNQIFLMLGRIEAKLDSYAGLHDGLAKQVEDINKRLGIIENDKTKAVTTYNTLRVGLILVGTGLGMFMSHIIKFITG
jgi:hypothetical protein